MGQDSKIEWTHHTFNAWVGCTKVSDGCANCYAESLMDKRFGRAKWGPAGTRVVASDVAWREPMKWNKEAAASGERHRVFCASLADVFEDWPGLLRRNEKGEAVALWHGPAKPGAFGLCTAGQMLVDPSRKSADGRPVLMDGYRWATLADVRARLIALIFCTPHLDWLLLTKRPENVVRMWDEAEAASGLPDPVGIGGFENVWIGTSIEDQATADARIPELMKIPAAVRFLSCEPLLGPVDLKQWLPRDPYYVARCGDCGLVVSSEWVRGDCLDEAAMYCPKCDSENIDEAQGIDWVICGGESGGGARPMHPDWARGLRDQCTAAGVPFFFKQWGEWAPGESVDGPQTRTERVAYNPDGEGEWVFGKITPRESEELDREFEPDVYRVGKARGGRWLDGRTWDEFPAAKGGA